MISKQFGCRVKTKNQEQMENFEILKHIDGGAFGQVYKCQDLDNDREVAIKIFLLDPGRKQDRGAVSIREIDRIKRCQHDFVVKVFSVIYADVFDSNFVIPKHQDLDLAFLVMELGDESLHEYSRRKNVPMSHRKRILFQITQAVDYLHSKEIAHRDIKPGNILITFNEKGLATPKLCDFGVAKRLSCNTPHSTYVGTSTYRAPELLTKSSNYTKMCDIWSLAITFIEVVDHSTWSPSRSDEQVFGQLLHIFGCPPKNLYESWYQSGPVWLKKSYQALSLKHGSRKSCQDLFKESLSEFDGFKLLWEAKPDGMKNFGSFEDFCEMLDKMLLWESSLRISSEEILKHNFWFEIPTSGNGEGWFGLQHRKKSPDFATSGDFTLEKISDQSIRLKCFDPIFHLKDAEKFWPSIFLTVDLIDRVLLWFFDQELVVTNYSTLGIACLHLALKYHHDFLAPRISKMCTVPFHSPNLEEVTNFERLVLTKIFDWQFFRVTVYDLLVKKTKLELLLKLLITNEKIFGKKVSAIAKTFDRIVCKKTEKEFS